MSHQDSSTSWSELITAAAVMGIIAFPFLV
jgi:hypothetical protein